MTETAAAAIDAVGKLMFVIAKLLAPPRVVKNAAVENDGGNEFISRDWELLLIKLHKILAYVPVRYSPTGARLFSIFVMIYEFDLPSDKSMEKIKGLDSILASVYSLVAAS